MINIFNKNNLSISHEFYFCFFILFYCSTNFAMALDAPTSIKNSTIPSNFNAESAERPPQFIAVSFDGSYNLQMWQETRNQARYAQEFAKQQNSNFKPAFTYFISGVYFFSHQFRKQNYKVPGPIPSGSGSYYVKQGASAISYDKNGNEAIDDISERVNQMENAMLEGAEIGSHANGHWDGSLWNYDGWMSELKQFNHFIENLFSINTPQYTPGATISLLDHLGQKNYINSQTGDWSLNWAQRVHDEIKGLRAPLLASNQNMFKVERDLGYTFDASTTGKMNEWPHLDQNGLWRFHLASIPVFGTARTQLSMDYNFYYFDSKAKPDSKNSEKYSERYYQSLYHFFLNNYYGSRAPIDIGNHFTAWNNGAYFNGLMKFVKKVCYNPEFPEVQCLNYSKIIENLNTAKQNGQLEAWRQGHFQKLPQTMDDFIDTNLNIKLTYDFQMNWKFDKGTDQIFLNISPKLDATKDLRKDNLISETLNDSSLNWYYKIYEATPNTSMIKNFADYNLDYGIDNQTNKIKTSFVKTSFALGKLILQPQEFTSILRSQTRIHNFEPVKSMTTVSLKNLNLQKLADGNYYLSLATIKRSPDQDFDSTDLFNEVLSSTHLIRVKDHKIVYVEKMEWEAKSSFGDMIEAHESTDSI